MRGTSRAGPLSQNLTVSFPAHVGSADWDTSLHQSWLAISVHFLPPELPSQGCCSTEREKQGAQRRGPRYRDAHFRLACLYRLLSSMA
jgi:hypothetical protein